MHSFKWARSSTCVLFTFSGWKSLFHTGAGGEVIPFRQNLLGSIRPFLEPIQFCVPSAMSLNTTGSLQKQECITRRETPAKEVHIYGKVQLCIFLQTRCVLHRKSYQWLSGDLTGDNFSACDIPWRKTTNYFYGFHLWYGMKFPLYTPCRFSVMEIIAPPQKKLISSHLDL